ncbi:spore germination protein KC [Paenibacillus rhizosphaerae]|uniref:Spore germination protein KC n=1 Tax=Paenibacillus rhizosphaerae TaxID=297318 RepID=A0A839TNI3_9BACL|nr:Ger(x)C family spore germination protein [Paenibacillus rhizosphaerae]MBB3128464.1 spore germination protein KC [Paenibacillus rhizosphaerae]
MTPFLRTALPILFLSLMLQGCGDYREISDLAIVDMVGVDMDADGNYLAYFQVANPNGIASTKGGGSRSPIFTYEFKGKSWAEFTSKATQTVPRELFLSHFQAYIVSKRLAAKGLGDLLNFLESDPSRRMATAVFITKDSVRDIMNTYVPLETNIGKNLRNIQQLQVDFTGKEVGESKINTLLENFESSRLTFVSNIMLSSEKPITTTKRYESIDGNRGNFTYTGVSIIKKGQFLGELKAKQVAPLYFMLGKSKTLYQHIQLSSDEFADLQMLSKPKMKRRFILIDGEPTLQLTIKPKIKLLNIHQNKRLDSQTLRRLEKMFDEEMTDQVTEVLNLAKKEKWDLLGIEERISHTTGRGWTELKKNPDSWMRTKVTLDIKSSIVKTGVLVTTYEGG